MSGRHDAGLVYLVRHGKTAGNGECYVGWLDLPLDATGLQQAREAGRCLAGHRLDAVHASPLARAQATAHALLAGHPGAASIERHAEPDLREIHYGAYAGRDKRVHPLKLRHDHVDRRLPDGECLDDVAARVRTYLAHHLRPALAEGRAVAVVAHFWSLRLLLGALRGQDFAALLRARDYKPGNGSVYALPVAVGADGTALACGTLDCLLEPGARAEAPAVGPRSTVDAG